MSNNRKDAGTKNIITERKVIMNEELYHLWLGMFPTMMNNILTEILEYFGGVYELWNVDEEILRENLSEKRCEAILRYRDEKIVREYKKKLDDRGITFIYPGHEYFPDKLLNIPDCPNLLYAKGRVEELNKRDRYGIAIVGARKASSYGMGNASFFAERLAEHNITIISGMASGIDGAAHKGAIEGGAFSVAVLGCGINICYPKENYRIFETLCQEGVVLSEYGLDVMPEPWRFPPRNRIISGLSDGVLVIEAREKSGSLITADQALEQGRDVYAVPGRIYDINSKGCNNLIKAGAVCVTEPEDIIRNMGLDSDINDFENCKKNNLTDVEKRILSGITSNPVHIEAICENIHMPVSEVLQYIYDMEKKKLVRQPVKNYFSTL
jgi:DNA processing protein